MPSNSTLSDVELLERLVGFDSTSHRSNLPIADFIAEYLDRPGLRVEQQPAPEEPKVNLIVSTGPEVDGDHRRGLVLSGHMDVVPALEPEWESDPFSLREAQGRLYGRGSCDMKGFVALAINAAVAANEQRLAYPLVLVLTYDEELGTLGARHFAQTWPGERPLPRRAIIGEPTSLQAVRLHKGHAKLRLETRGRSAHSGYPHLGQNAIEPMAEAVLALATLRQELEKETGSHSQHFPEVPFVALNVARIQGGAAVNIIPELCQLDFGYRVLPGMQAEEVAERVRNALDNALGKNSYGLELLSESPPLGLAEDNDFYREVAGELGQHDTVSASYATDAGWLQECGMDCLLLGPGDIALAHRPNEYVPLDEMTQASELLATMVHRYCVQEQGAAPARETHRD